MKSKYFLYKIDSPIGNSDNSYVLDIIKNSDNMESHFYYLIMEKLNNYNIVKITSTRPFLLYLQNMHNDVDICSDEKSTFIINKVIKAILDKKIKSDGSVICNGINNMTKSNFETFLSLVKLDVKGNDNKNKNHIN